MRPFVLLILFYVPLFVYSQELRVLHWDDLVPDKAQEILRTSKPRAINHDGSLAVQKDNIEYNLLNHELTDQYVKIPGFVVPLEMQNNKVIEFFIVPYFGACIHVPPPPPNQLLHATSKIGIDVSDLNQPYWFQGKITANMTENSIAKAGYQLSLDEVALYDGY
ncbi:DUF3299 domain-containing protein [Vibrio sp. F74]|uniref:DUF3299 domain-containing protein n=1 Tax=Vibrio sp. F74 TaxID=700020 RepID=UPI0035F5E022